MFGFHAFSVEPFSTLTPETRRVASVPIRYGRWASYRSADSGYIRQVSPGVYLRIRPEESIPEVIVENVSLGPVTELPLRGPDTVALLARGLERRTIRKLREEARKPAEVFLPKADIWVEIEDIAALVAMNVI